MADETPGAGGQGDHIMGLGLDIAPYAQALSAALKQYEVFRSEFQKSLSIRLDPTSMNSLSNAFGIQMRQAVGLIKGAQKETVKESAETVSKINTEFKKLSGFEAFRELAKKAREANAGVKREMTDLTASAKQAGEKTGDAIAAGVKKGADGAKAQLAEVNTAAQHLANAQAAVARGNRSEAERATEILSKTLARYSKKVGGGTATDDLRKKANVDPTNVPFKEVGKGSEKKSVVDMDAVLLKVRQIRAAFAELTGTTHTYLDRTGSLAERAAARLDKLLSIQSKLNAAGQQEYARLRQQKALEESGEPLADRFQKGRTPLGRLGSPEDLTRQIFVTDKAAGTVEERQLLAERKFQSELAMHQQALRAQKDLAKADAKTLSDKVQGIRAFYQYAAAEEKKAIADKNMAEADRIRRQIQGARAYYRFVREEEKRVAQEQKARDRGDAQAVRAQSGYQAAKVASIARAETVASSADTRIAKVAATTGLSFKNVNPSEFLDPNGLVDKQQVSAINSLTRAAATEMAEYNRLLDARNSIIRENARNEERINSALDKAKAKAPQLGAELDRRADALRQQLRQVPAVPQVGPAVSQLSTRYGTGQRDFNNGIVQTRPSEPVAPSRINTGSMDPAMMAKGYAAASKEAQGLFKLQEGIGASILKQGTNMVKWLFMYKAVHEITRLVQTGLRNIVQAGIDYTRSLETQQIALRAILAENFDLTDNQGRQLKGMEALSALQGESRRQWGQIQQASLAVVGTTSDLMTLYAGILPFASQLGADLSQIQDLTKGAAVAASLLDVSFQDARSAMISLLQGRALTRNRLVGALGFTKQEIESVSGLDRLTLIRSRLEQFILSADEAQETLAALSESFTDFTGIVASGFTSPFTDLFKEMVKGLTDSNKSWSIFEKTVNGSGLTLKKSLQAFISFTRTAMLDALEPLRAFGSELTRQSSSDLKLWVMGISQITKASLQFLVALTKIGIAITTFIASNRELLKFLGAVFAISAGVNMFLKLAGAWTTAATSGNFLISTLKLLTGVLVVTGKSVSGVGSSAANAASLWDRLGASIKSVASFAKFTAITAAIAFLTHKFFQLKQEAESAAEAIKAMREGDVNRTIQAAQDGFNSSDPRKKEGAAKAVIGVADTVFARASNFFGGEVTVANAVKTQQRFKAELEGLEKERVANSEKIAKLITRGGTNLTKEQLDEITKLREENARIRGSIKDKNAERNQIQQDLQSTIAILGEDANVKETVDALSDVSKRVLSGLIKEIDQFGLQQFDESGKPKLHKDGTPVRGSITIPGLGVAPMMRGLGRGLRTPGSRPAAPLLPEAAEIAASWNSIKERVANLSAVVGAFEDEDTPTFNFRDLPPEKEDVQGDRWTGSADEKIRQLEARVAIEKSILDRTVAARLQTQAEADVKLEAMERKLLAQKIELYKEDQASYEKYVAQKAVEKKPVDDDQVKAQREEFKANISEADKEFQVLVNNQGTNSLRRTNAFNDELKDAVMELARYNAEVFGTVEDTALAAFDKNIENIRQKLQSLKFSPEQQVVIDTFLIQAGQARPGIGDMSRYESSIKTNEKRLTLAREDESILLKQFEVGEIGATKYLARIREIRMEQVAVLEQLELAFSARANQKELGLIKDGDPEKMASLRIEIAQFRSQAAQARAQIADILDTSRRIEAALQAWSNLTGHVREFLGAANGLDGTNTAIETMIDGLTTASGLMDQITKSAESFAKISGAFQQFKAMFSDAEGGSRIGDSFKALGGLAVGGVKSVAGLFGGGDKSPTDYVKTDVNKANDMLSGVKGFAKALPAIGIALSAAMAIGSAIFNRGVESAKKSITKSFESISKSLASGSVTLGKSIAEAEAERARLVAHFSKTKAGRKALKDLLPGIDAEIEAMKQRAKDIAKSFEDAYKEMVMFDTGGNRVKPGPFANFAKELMDLEKFVKEYLDSIAMNTRNGTKEMAQALANVDRYVQAFFENAKLQFGEELLGFESEALAAQERLFSLINNQDGLYKQLRDLAEDRLDLEEAVQEEMERRSEAQNELNDLAKKELEIRKRIAEIIRQAAEDEMAIRRRGVLEAQLSIAQQKATEISALRYKAQEEIDKLRQELAELSVKVKDQTEDNAKKDRNFDRQRRSLDEREQDINRELRLNSIRISGAQAVADIQGAIFGMAADEFELAERQNMLAIAQAEIQVSKWRETKALFDAIIRGSDGFFLDPPAGFPQIKVELGSITIDNSDNSSNTFEAPAAHVPNPGARPNPNGPPGNGARPNPNVSTEAAEAGRNARVQGYGDLV